MRLLKIQLTAALASFLMLPGAVEAQITPASPPYCTASASVYVGFPAYVDCSGAWTIDPNSVTTPENRVAIANLIYTEFGLNWGTSNYLWDTEYGSLGFTATPTGTITFPSPLTGMYVLMLKGGNNFSMFRFNFTNATSSVAFSMAGVEVNSQGKPRDLSHAALWGVPTVVPEPSTVFLLGTGLLGLGIVGYRRRRQRS